MNAVITQRSILIITLLSILLFCINAPAETKDELLLFEEIPVVITAAKKTQSITEAPGTISVITAQQIKESGARTLKDVLRSIPGMDIRERGNTIIVSARGFGGSLGNNALFLMDGRILNTYSGNSFDAGLPLPLTNVKQIEVIRGPGSSLYGANALVSVINIITKMPEDVNGVQVSTAVGSKDIQKYELLYGENKGKIGRLFTFRGYKTHGWQANATNNSDDLEDVDFYGKFLTDRTTFSFGYSNMERGNPGSLISRLTETREKLEDGFAYLAHNIKLGEKTDLVSRLYFNRSDNGNVLEQTGGTLKYTLKRDELLASELQLNHQISERHMLMWGVDLRRNEEKDSDIGTNHVTTKASYVEDEFSPFDKLKINIGGRYDEESNSKEFSPRISGIYNYSEKTRLRMSYGEAFRAPNFSELYINQQVSQRLTIKGDPNLLPEKIKTYEIGLDRSLTNSLKGTINLFYSLADDLITFETSSGASPGTSIIQVINNRNRAESQGFEIELNNRFNSRLSGYVNYAYQETEDEGTGMELLYAPKHKINMGMNLDINKYLIFDTTAHYVGERLASSTRELGGYYTTDLKLTGKPDEKLEISLAVYNLFDRRYEETLNYGMPGMTWLIEAGYKF